MPDLPESGGSVRSARSGRLLVIGLGTVIAVWTVMYITASPYGNLLVGVRVGLGAALVSICLLAGGFVGGRKAGFGPKDGVMLGVFVTVISLLVLLSLVGKPSGGVAISAAWWILGFLGVSCLLGAVGSQIGRAGAQGRGDSREINWTHCLAVVTAIATLLMIISGGIVTGLKAGLAIEGWWTADGHILVLLPVEIMTGDSGKFAEHAHRLWGLLVGLSTILLAIRLWRTDDRRWLRNLGVIVVLAVIVQGVIGGTRVTEKSIALAVMHGVFAQLVFGLIAVMAACTTTSWRNAGELPEVATAKKDRRFSVGLPGMVLIQITLGALYRHLDVDGDGKLHPTMHAHMLVAAFVLVKALLVGGRMWARYTDRPGLPTAGKWVLITVGVQLLLGVVALVVILMRGEQVEAPTMEVIITTIHQAMGAIIMALSCVLVAWAFRVLRGGGAAKAAAT